MSRATHAHPAALVAACVIAACASWALEGASPSMLLEAAIEEAREAAQPVTTEARLAEMLTQVSAGTWQPPANGISLDPYETVAAVLWCATRATSLRSGLVSAVQLGGDTDTVAAWWAALRNLSSQMRHQAAWVVCGERSSSGVAGGSLIQARAGIWRGRGQRWNRSGWVL